MILPTFRRSRCPGALLVAMIATQPMPVEAGALTGQATEWTQILNNSELMALTGQSAQQVQNQVTQIAQLSEQIQNQLNIYANMLQNTAVLPERVWGEVENDLNQLRNLVSQGQGIAFSMGSLDDVLKARFQSFSQVRTGLAEGESFSASYQSWSDTNRDTIAATLRAAGLTASQFDGEEATMAQLRSASESANGQLKALQLGHEIAVQQVAQTQKLRGLVAQNVTMLGTWLQSEQVSRDLSQNRREQFFNSTAPSTSGGQQMAPRW